MTKEKYSLDEPELPEEYDQVEMPETFFENLYAADQVNSPLYNIWQSELYQNLKALGQVEATDAQKITQYLNKGEIEQAEELTGEILEE